MGKQLTWTEQQWFVVQTILELKLFLSSHPTPNVENQKLPKPGYQKVFCGVFFLIFFLF